MNYSIISTFCTSVTGSTYAFHRPTEFIKRNCLQTAFPAFSTEFYTVASSDYSKFSCQVKFATTLITVWITSTPTCAHKFTWILWVFRNLSRRIWITGCSTVVKINSIFPVTFRIIASLCLSKAYTPSFLYHLSPSPTLLSCIAKCCV